MSKYTKVQSKYTKISSFSFLIQIYNLTDLVDINYTWRYQKQVDKNTLNFQKNKKKWY